MQELPVLDTRDDVADHCRCDGGQPKNFARPCLLLLLAEAPGHGYELMERLTALAADWGGPGPI